MDNGSSNSRRRSVFKRDELSRLLAAADAVPKKSDTKSELTVRELVHEIKPGLREMVKKGYSHQDIARFLIAQGVPFAEDTLKTTIGGELGRRRRTVRNGVEPAALGDDEAKTGSGSASKTPDPSEQGVSIGGLSAAIGDRKTDIPEAPVTHVLPPSLPRSTPAFVQPRRSLSSLDEDV